MTVVLSAHPTFVLPLLLGGVNPPTVLPFRDRGQIRWAVNFELVFTTLRWRLPFRAVVPTRCLGCGGCVSPLAHLDLTIMMVIDGTCSRALGSQPFPLGGKRLGCTLYKGGSLPAGYPYRIRCLRS
jgi:hypothetical protein